MGTTSKYGLVASLFAALGLSACAEGGDEGPFRAQDSGGALFPIADSGSPWTGSGGNPDLGGSSVVEAARPSSPAPSASDGGSGDSGATTPPAPGTTPGGLAKTKINEMRKVGDWTYYEVEGAK